MTPSPRTTVDATPPNRTVPDHETPPSQATVGNCPECDYDLRGAPGDRCPWCGWEIDLDVIAEATGSARSGHRWGIVVTATALGTASLVVIFSLVQRGRGFDVLDGFTVLAVAVAGFGHLALAVLALQSKGRWPMRPGEGAVVLRFVGWCCVAAGVIGATQALHPPPTLRSHGGMPVSGALEFMVRAGFQMFPGCALLVLRLLAFRRDETDRGTRLDAERFGASAGKVAPFTIEVLGRYTHEQVTYAWHATPRRTTASLERQIAQVWEAELAVAREEGRPLFNGTLARLIRAEANPAHLGLVLGPTCYRDFLATNLRDAERFPEIDPASLADAVGVSATVITLDGFLAFGRRSRLVAYHAGCVHPFGGMLEEADRGSDGKIDAFGCAARELCEEVGLVASEIDDSVIVGLVRDRAIHQPELMFDVTVTLSRSALIARMSAMPGEHEHTAIEFVHDEPDALAACLARGDSLTPVCQAAILLHGFLTWGQAWYEKTCLVLYGEVPGA